MNQPQQQCLFCGQPVTLVHVHGHYQCPVCHTNALPCCDGDNCDTNLLLQPAVNRPLDQPGPNNSPRFSSQDTQGRV